MEKIGILATYTNPTTKKIETTHFANWRSFGDFVSEKFETGNQKQKEEFRAFVGEKLKRITNDFWTVDISEYIPPINNLTFTTYQKRYCGTTYTVENIPENFTEEDIITACGVTVGWWISGFVRRGNMARFNVNYD